MNTHTDVRQTNGITPRRWLLKCNTALAEIITQHIGREWTTDLFQLKALLPFIESPDNGELLRELHKVKQVSQRGVIA